MWIKVTKDNLSFNYEAKSRWIASLLIALGAISFIYALFSAFSLRSIVGVTLAATGIVTLYLTAKINPHVYTSWARSLLLLLGGLSILLFSRSDISSAALFITAFFLLYALSGFYLAYQVQCESTAYAWIANALFNLLFAYLAFSAVEKIEIGLCLTLALIADGLTVLYSGRHVYIRP